MVGFAPCLAILWPKAAIRIEAKSRLDDIKLWFFIESLMGFFIQCRISYFRDRIETLVVLMPFPQSRCLKGTDANEWDAVMTFVTGRRGGSHVAKVQNWATRNYGKQALNPV